MTYVAAVEFPCFTGLISDMRATHMPLSGTEYTGPNTAFSSARPAVDVADRRPESADAPTEQQMVNIVPAHAASPAGARSSVGR